jgi:hypothetical protein
MHEIKLSTICQVVSTGYKVTKYIPVWGTGRGARAGGASRRGRVGRRRPRGREQGGAWLMGRGHGGARPRGRGGEGVAARGRGGTAEPGRGIVGVSVCGEQLGREAGRG